MKIQFYIFCLSLFVACQQLDFTKKSNGNVEIQSFKIDTTSVCFSMDMIRHHNINFYQVKDDIWQFSYSAERLKGNHIEDFIYKFERKCEWKYFSLDSIMVKCVGGEYTTLTHSKPGIHSFTGASDISGIVNTTIFSLKDYNFDGHKDIEVQSHLSGNQNAIKIVFLYQEENKKFVRSKAIKMMTNPYPDTTKKQIVSGYTLGLRYGYGANYYKWINDDSLALVKSYFTKPLNFGDSCETTKKIYSTDSSIIMYVDTIACTH